MVEQWPFRSFMPLCNPFDFWELGFYNLAGPSHVSDLAIGVDGGAGPKRRVTVGARFVCTLLDFHAVLLKIMRSMWCNYVTASQFHRDLLLLTQSSAHIRFI